MAILARTEKYSRFRCCRLLADSIAWVGESAKKTQ